MAYLLTFYQFEFGGLMVHSKARRNRERPTKKQKNPVRNSLVELCKNTIFLIRKYMLHSIELKGCFQ
jgi:hypothetical protein